MAWDARGPDNNGRTGCWLSPGHAVGGTERCEAACGSLPELSVGIEPSRDRRGTTWSRTLASCAVVTGTQVPA